MSSEPLSGDASPASRRRGREEGLEGGQVGGGGGGLRTLQQLLQNKTKGRMEI